MFITPLTPTPPSPFILHAQPPPVLALLIPVLNGASKMK